jgi:hypothetical protein
VFCQAGLPHPDSVHLTSCRVSNATYWMVLSAMHIRPFLFFYSNFLGVSGGISVKQCFTCGLFFFFTSSNVFNFQVINSLFGPALSLLLICIHPETIHFLHWIHFEGIFLPFLIVLPLFCVCVLLFSVTHLCEVNDGNPCISQKT